LKIDVTSASGTPSAGNYAFIRTKFEGQDLQHIRKGTSAAKPLTLSFWVSSPKTGTHVVELYDTDNNRQVSKAYTINSANTWQHFSILMPADTTGTLDNDSNLSMQVAFWLMAGSDFSGGTLNTSWAANNNSNRAVGQVNCMDNTSNNFYLTGVCLNVGDSAIDFPHESYGETLARCQRYCQKIRTGTDAGFGMYHSYTSSSSYAPIQLPVTMRATPSASITNGNAVTLFTGGTNYNPSATTFINASPSSVEVKFGTTGNATAGDTGWYRLQAAFTMILNADL